MCCVLCCAVGSVLVVRCALLINSRCGVDRLSVQDTSGSSVPIQFLPNSDAGASAQYWLVFEAEVPAWGFNTYFLMNSGRQQVVVDSDSMVIEYGTDDRLARLIACLLACLLACFIELQHTYTKHISSSHAPAHVHTCTDPASIDPSEAAAPALENAYLRVTFDPTTNQLTTLTNKVSGVTLQLNQSIMWYTPSKGTKMDSTCHALHLISFHWMRWVFSSFFFSSHTKLTLFFFR